MRGVDGERRGPIAAGHFAVDPLPTRSAPAAGRRTDAPNLRPRPMLGGRRLDEPPDAERGRLARGPRRRHGHGAGEVRLLFTPEAGLGAGESISRRPIGRSGDRHKSSARPPPKDAKVGSPTPPGTAIAGPILGWSPPGTIRRSMTRSAIRYATHVAPRAYAAVGSPTTPAGSTTISGDQRAPSLSTSVPSHSRRCSAPYAAKRGGDDPVWVRHASPAPARHRRGRHRTHGRCFRALVVVDVGHHVLLAQDPVPVPVDQVEWPSRLGLSRY